MKTKRKLSNAEIASFCDQTAIILDAGVSAVEGMRILLSDTKDEAGKDIIRIILSSCEKGEYLWIGMNKTGVFPDYVINMVRLGEESGCTDNVMRSLADYYEREDIIAENIKSALRYPLIMIGMMMVVILVLIIKVLPIFNQVFIQLGSEITGFARSLMSLGDTLKDYALVFVIILGVILLVILFASKTRVGKKISSGILSVFPVTRGFYEQVAAGRFASGMAMTLGSGLDTYRSIELVSKLVENKTVEAKVLSCKDMIQKGDNLAEAVVKNKIFSNLFAKMIAVGFKTGNVDVVMKKIADNYEKETGDRLYRIISVLEPTLVIVLSLIVGLILLSVILPLMGIMSTIG